MSELPHTNLEEAGKQDSRVVVKGKRSETTDQERETLDKENITKSVLHLCDTGGLVLLCLLESQ